MSKRYTENSPQKTAPEATRDLVCRWLVDQEIGPGNHALSVRVLYTRFIEFLDEKNEAFKPSFLGFSKAISRHLIKTTYSGNTHYFTNLEGK